MIVYRHIRIDTNEVFYIGIGKEIKRAYIKHGRSTFWDNIVSKCGYRVEVLASNLTRETACELEMFLIELYGRRDLNKGSLVNLTDGGDYIQGYIITSEDRAKMSTSRIGYKMTEQAKMKLSKTRKGIKFSDNHKEKLKFAKVGIKKSKEHLSKLIESRKKAVLQYDLDGSTIREFDSIKTASQFLKIKSSKISETCLGKRKTTRGFIFKHKKCK